MARPRLHDETVQQRLVEEASSIIARQGADALSMRKAASAANTTTTAIYSLFGSREALINAVVTEGFQRFATHLNAVPHTDQPGTDLLALGKAYRANALENPNFYRAMFHHSPTSQAPNRESETFTTLVDAVERAAQCPRSEAEVRAYRLWAYIHGLVSLELSGFAESSTATDDVEQDFILALRSATSLFQSPRD